MADIVTLNPKYLSDIFKSKDDLLHKHNSVTTPKEFNTGAKILYDLYFISTPPPIIPISPLESCFFNPGPWGDNSAWGFCVSAHLSRRAPAVLCLDCHFKDVCMLYGKQLQKVKRVSPSKVKGVLTVQYKKDSISRWGTDRTGLCPL